MCNNQTPEHIIHSSTSSVSLIMASTIFYPINRFATHIIIMSMSLAITAGSRPYTDSENNMVSILFCVVDILGAVSSISNCCHGARFYGCS